MDKIQLSQGCRATTGTEFTFSHRIPGTHLIDLEE